MLWLDELHQYAEADGGPALLGRPADLLDDEGPWSSPLCGPSSGPPTLLRRALGSARPIWPGLPDGSSTGWRNWPTVTLPGSTLFVAGVIDVPSRFTRANLEAATRADDSVLAAAAADARQDGQVT